MDVTAIAWRTSSYSGDNGGNCVEVGTTGPAVAVRDTKHPDGPQLAFATDTWKAFTDKLKAMALPQVLNRERPFAQKRVLSSPSAGRFRPCLSCSPAFTSAAYRSWFNSSNRSRIS
jgi:Domain of unknown function (DUF397)